MVYHSPLAIGRRSHIDGVTRAGHDVGPAAAALKRAARTCSSMRSFSIACVVLLAVHYSIFRRVRVPRFARSITIFAK